LRITVGVGGCYGFSGARQLAARARIERHSTQSPTGSAASPEAGKCGRSGIFGLARLELVRLAGTIVVPGVSRAGPVLVLRVDRSACPPCTGRIGAPAIGRASRSSPGVFELALRRH